MEVGYSGTTRNWWENICPPKQLVHPSAQVNLFVNFFSCNTWNGTGFGGDVYEVGSQDRIGKPLCQPRNSQTYLPHTVTPLAPAMWWLTVTGSLAGAGHFSPVEPSWGEAWRLTLSLLGLDIIEYFPPKGQLSFIWQAKEYTSLGMRAGWLKEERGSILAPLFMFFLLPLRLPYVNWASQDSRLFHLRSHSGPQTFLCSIFMGFSLLCLLATAILVSFFLF